MNFTNITIFSNVTNYISQNNCDYNSILNECMGSNTNKIFYIVLLLFIVNIYIALINWKETFNFKFYSKDIYNDIIFDLKKILQEISFVIIIVLFLYLLFQFIFY